MDEMRTRYMLSICPTIKRRALYKKEREKAEKRTCFGK